MCKVRLSLLFRYHHHSVFVIYYKFQAISLNNLKDILDFRTHDVLGSLCISDKPKLCLKNDVRSMRKSSKLYHSYTRERERGGGGGGGGGGGAEGGRNVGVPGIYAPPGHLHFCSGVCETEFPAFLPKSE